MRADSCVSCRDSCTNTGGSLSLLFSELMVLIVDCRYIEYTDCCYFILYIICALTIFNVCYFAHSHGAFVVCSSHLLSGRERDWVL